MNGKRVRMAVMSAVILSALAVSGCSSEESVSYNESGEKADDVSASLSTPVTSDTTNSSESKETQEQTSSESKPAVTTTNKAETTAVTTKKDNAVKSEWKETKADGTKYVTVGCYSREKAVLGAKTVKLYNVNDKVTVVAVTDTGYAKLKDGTFIHNDFLSDSKVTVTAAPTSQSSKKPTEQKPAQSQTSEYSWVIKPSYVYDEVEILMDCQVNPDSIKGEDEISIPYGYTYKIAKVTPTPDDPYSSYMYEPGGRINGIFVVTTNGKKYAVDSSGKKIVNQGFDYITNPYGLIAFRNANDDKCYSLDDNGKLMEGVDGILVPGGFGDRGIEGKIKAVQYARENKVPFFGICLGMQCAVIEYARNVCGLENANSAEFVADCKYPVIDLMPEQVSVEDKGGTMRLGLYPCKVYPGTLTEKAYKEELVYERHRHRYEVNNALREQIVDGGLRIGGTLPNGRLVEIVEIPEDRHPWFLGAQFHPEFKSRPTNPHPLFRDFIAAALREQK